MYICYCSLLVVKVCILLVYTVSLSRSEGMYITVVFVKVCKVFLEVKVCILL